MLYRKLSATLVRLNGVFGVCMLRDVPRQNQKDRVLRPAVSGHRVDCQPLVVYRLLNELARGRETYLWCGVR